MKKLGLLLSGLFTVVQLLAAQNLVSVKHTDINEDFFTVIYDLQEKVVKDNNGNFIPIAGLNISVSIVAEGEEVRPDSRYLYGVGEQHAGKSKEVIWYYRKQLDKDIAKEDVSISIIAEVPPGVLKNIERSNSKNSESLVPFDYGLMAIAAGGAGFLFNGFKNLGDANSQRTKLRLPSGQLQACFVEQGVSTTIEAYEASEASNRSNGTNQVIVGGIGLGVAGSILILRLLNRSKINETINEPDTYSNLKVSPKVEMNSAIANYGLSLTYNF